MIDLIELLLLVQDGREGKGNDALPEDTIPPGCAADLRAVAEAIEVQMETP